MCPSRDLLLECAFMQRESESKCWFIPLKKLHMASDEDNNYKGPTNLQNKVKNNNKKWQC